MSRDDRQYLSLLLDKMAELIKRSVSLRNYLVVAVSAGAARDGSAQVTILVDSDNVAAPYLASYSSPTVGDVVAVLTVFRSPLILGRVIGLPTI